MQPTLRLLRWIAAGLALTLAPVLDPVLATSRPALARTLEVGEGRAFASLGDAARAAGDGDTVLIRAGTYFGCAVWKAARLTIAGEGPATVVSDAACDGKAAFVIQGDDATVRDLTLTRVRAEDGNGAGIRAEGRNLLVERVAFVNNQRGILAGDQPGGRIQVVASEFAANGNPGDSRPSPALAIGQVALLEVRDSYFHDARAGSAILSGAARTVVADSRFSASGDPAPIHVTGPVELRGNRFELLPGAGDRVAVLLTGGGEAVVTGNQLASSGEAAFLVQDWRDGDPVLTGNQIPPGSQEVTTAGALMHQAKATARSGVDGVRDVLRAARRELRAVLNR